MNLDSCVEQSLALLTDDVRGRFAADPLNVLRSDLRLTVTAVDQLATTRADGGACDGVSFLEDGVILYASTPMSRRENFTLAHELGHWLAEKAADVYDWIADQDHPGPLLESVCDRIAQRLLLPEAAASALIGPGPIRATHLLDLYEKTQASRPVCAIALARHIPDLGATVIIDRYTGTVTHATIKPGSDANWPAVYPWSGQQLSESHPLLAVAPGTTKSRRLVWRTPWGAQADFYVDATGDAKRVYAVFCGRDLWKVEQFHAPVERDYDTRELLRGSCCGTIFHRRGYPCSECQQPYCPTCGECRCGRDARRDETCTRCFLQVKPHRIANGVCDDCRL